MSAPILPVSTGAISEPIRPSGASSGASAFQNVFASAINDVEAFQQNAAASVQRFMSGDGEELHTTILASQQAELSFELFQQVRGKVVSAYQEIMRMQM